MNKITDITKPKKAFDYAKRIGRRIPELEPVIIKDPMWAYYYARDVIKGRWPEVEHIIIENQDSSVALWYARDVIKGRWPEAEPIIMKQPEIAFYYAKDVIKGRWPEAEPYIMKEKPYIIYQYITDVIKGSWPEAEPYLMTDLDLANEYFRYFPEASNPNKNFPLMLGNYVIEDVSNIITNDQIYKMTKILEPSASLCYNFNMTSLRINCISIYERKLKTQNFIKISTKQLIEDDALRLSFLKSIHCISSNDFS